MQMMNYLRECFVKFLPPVLRTFDKTEDVNSLEAERRYIMENFPSYPNLSIDEAILEKSENVCMMKCDFGWADLGTWHSIYEAMQKSEDDNVIIDSDVVLDDAKGNVVKLPKGKLAVINGLDGYIVAEEDNVLLICKKEDSSALVRKFVNEVAQHRRQKLHETFTQIVHVAQEQASIPIKLATLHKHLSEVSIRLLSKRLNLIEVILYPIAKLNITITRLRTRRLHTHRKQSLVTLNKLQSLLIPLLFYSRKNL